MIYFIVAVDENNGIGKNGRLPWTLKEEMKHFMEITLATKDPHRQNMLVMGRSTWESIPARNRPLKNRKNVVLSKREDLQLSGAKVANSIDEAFSLADATIENIFICGGASVFEAFIGRADLDGIYLTKIQKCYDCDTFFPAIPAIFSKISKLGSATEDGVTFDFLLYEKA